MPISSFAKTTQSYIISIQNKSKDCSKKLLNDAQEAPSNEDESKDETENFALKIFTSSTRIFEVYNQKEAKFILYNAQHIIQFKPEFSTPPPKQ